SCFPASGATFPIGTTTVNCSAQNPIGPPLSFPATGSFTVTVNVGAPSLSLALKGTGSDPNGFWIDLRLTNNGTGHARNVAINSLVFRTLTGRGVVTYRPALSGPLPINIGSIDVGNSQIVRLYMNVPPTVLRFSITEGLALQN